MSEVPGGGEPQPPAMPRWVKVSGLIAVALVVILIVILLLTGDHGPGRHGAQSLQLRIAP
jgi:hypothetical protein